MSYTQYEQYGGNPYGNASNMEAGQGRGRDQNYLAQPPLEHEMSNLSATSNYSNLAPPANPAGSTTLPQKPFLDEVTKVNLEIKQLVDLIPKLRDLHDRATSSADSSPPAELDALAADTQTQRTTIRNSIRYLEADAVRSNDQTKSTQVKTLKRNFQGMLNMYMAEEQRYKNKNVEQITRQYKIVYPNASEAEAKEAAQMNWGNEGVFQTALRDSTRSRQVNAAAGAVLTRHNEIAQIEKTIMELAAMFEDMAQLVDAQEPAVQRAEENAIQTTQDVQKANIEIDKANEHARRRNRLKWWCLLVVVLIVIAIALGVGLGVGLTAKATKTVTGS